MPRDKDFKRHVRRRMAGTGERYTRARERLRASSERFEWQLGGDRPEAWQASAEVDDRFPRKRIHVLTSIADPGAGVGMLGARLQAQEQRGNRVRFTASMRAEGVTSWAGLWMRIDAAPGSILAFDNMQDRPLHGTFDWRQVEIVLDVPREAETITLGLLVQGAGTVRMAGARLEAVDTSVPVTSPVGLASSVRPAAGGWMLGGSAARSYEVAVEPGTADGVAVLRSIAEVSDGMGFISRSVPAATYRGQRLRVRATLRGEDVETSAGLTMVITDAHGETLAFDDMWHRPLRGTFDWTPAAIVLDVPERAAGVVYGVGLIGEGAVRVADVRLDPVNDGSPVTNGHRRMVDGWALHSNDPDAYEVGDEPDERSPGERLALLRSTTAEPGDSASLLRWTTTGAHRGKLVRFTVALRGEDVDSGAFLWISSSAGQPAAGGLGSARQEPMLRGTFGWREAAVEAAIPEDASGVVYGVTLGGGRGAVYVSGPRLEIVEE